MIKKALLGRKDWGMRRESVFRGASLWRFCVGGNPGFSSQGGGGGIKNMIEDE